MFITRTLANMIEYNVGSDSRIPNSTYVRPMTPTSQRTASSRLMPASR